MRYDLHVHTMQYSPCAVSPAEEVCRAALDAGLHGIAFTEHDVVRPQAELDRLRKRFPSLILFQGVEFSCREGHFLIFLPDEDYRAVSSRRRVTKLIPAVRKRGGIVIWAHPFRYDKSPQGWLDRATPDGLEVGSSNMDSQARVLAEREAAGRGLAGFRNSDAHEAATIGRYYNHLGVPIRNAAELAAHIRSHARMDLAAP
jgi:hypothetical protein